jgi:hypothetical protein
MHSDILLSDLKISESSPTQWLQRWVEIDIHSAERDVAFEPGEFADNQQD